MVIISVIKRKSSPRNLDGFDRPERELLPCTHSSELQEIPGFLSSKQKLQIQGMPFGLNITPRIFSNLTNVCITVLRENGVSVLAYLDDWLVWGRSRPECQRNVQKHLQSSKREVSLST